MTRRALATLFLLSLPFHVQAAKLNSAAVDALVVDSLRTWQVPGLAVVIVQGDEVVYLKGHGVRVLGKTDPVTPDTVFALGSLTKAFTATALGILVDEGKAGWDDHVRKHLPAFRLADPLADREVRLRDLLCHRTGLTRHDLLWYRASWDLDESVRRMAFLAPTYSFRSRYAYNNLAYIACGQAIGKAAGSTWQEVVQSRLLDPLGMKNAVFTASAARAQKDHATPHRTDDAGKHHPIDWYPDDKQVRGSGSIKASVRDLTGWIRLQLGGGEIDGKRLISAEALEETHTPQVVVPLNRDLARRTGSTQASYGLGWHITDYHGRRILQHSGANDGFRAWLALLPKEKIGLALLANTEELDFVHATGHLLLDHLLDRPKSDWHAYYLKRAKSAVATRRQEDKRRMASRKKNTRPSRETMAYTGTYRDTAYGDVAVELKGDQLWLKWSSFRAGLEHFHFDTFTARSEKHTSRIDGEAVTFRLERDGSVGQLRFLGRTFRRVP